MEAVDVLVGVDRGDDLLLVDMLGQRQLHENAIDRGISVELLDHRQQIGLGRFGWQLVLEAVHARFHRALALGADIDLACRVLAHQHHGQASLAPGLGLERSGKIAHAGAQGGGEGLSVDHGSSHRL